MIRRQIIDTASYHRHQGKRKELAGQLPHVIKGVAYAALRPLRGGGFVGGVSVSWVSRPRCEAAGS